MKHLTVITLLILSSCTQSYTKPEVDAMFKSLGPHEQAQDYAINTTANRVFEKELLEIKKKRCEMNPESAECVKPAVKK